MVAATGDLIIPRRRMVLGLDVVLENLEENGVHAITHRWKPVLRSRMWWTAVRKARCSSGLGCNLWAPGALNLTVRRWLKLCSGRGTPTNTRGMIPIMRYMNVAPMTIEAVFVARHHLW